MTTFSLSQWVRRQETPASRLLYNSAKAILKWQVPVFPGIHLPLFKIHTGLSGFLTEGLSKLYWAPLFRSRLKGTSSRLHIAGSGMPLITGPVVIEMGNDCRLSSAITISGRGYSNPPPLLRIGNNVGIGWQTTIAVGHRIIIEDNVRIAGRSLFAGYPGHPTDPKDRALGLPDTEDQVGDIHLEKDVWLGTGVLVCKGVTIGQGSIVAAGSVVTKSLPAGVLAGGNPAKIIRKLNSPVIKAKDPTNISFKELYHD